MYSKTNIYNFEEDNLYFCLQLMGSSYKFDLTLSEDGSGEVLP